MSAGDLHDIHSIFPLCGKILGELLRGKKWPCHATHVTHAAPSGAFNPFQLMFSGDIFFLPFKSSFTAKLHDGPGQPLAAAGTLFFIFRFFRRYIRH